MPAPATLAALAKRRMVLRASVSAAVVLVMVGAFAFSACVVVLAINPVSAGSICRLEGLITEDANPVNVVPDSQAPAGLSARQAAVARGYISVGKQLRVPRDGQIIAIMMALQESSLRVMANSNVPASLRFPHDGVGSDHDSLGTAQQRPAAGWGTIEQLMDPTYNVRAFYGGPTGPNHGSPPGLLDIPGWQFMSKGQAAQAVQVSAFPELYARWEREASAIADALDGAVAAGRCLDSSRVSKPVLQPANLSQLRKDILRFTKEGLGGKYVWGGAAFKAWDCSGYVQWIYRQAGINLPRVEQWRVGVRTLTPKPGDLVVQNAQGPNNWGHVGIYAGNGMVYSALNPAVGTLLHPIGWNTDTAYFDLLT
ncbi:C40 family peptidase [Arthrobacter sp. FW305-BF8]|uniref:C40 family peptidase n=1 Tax=Arthrobacter sp. FW305-BF8 TaxID=2879617 RepID=UPI001F3DDE3A|nr:NlpC/P60 family protein [Arthrobacter sp. FW305-BF8]UKA55150.1 C40 family peptidase [Arthrobacter sp. FW305-BF8]